MSLIQWAIWREGRKWWGCWYNKTNHRIESMCGGFRSAKAAEKFAKEGWEAQ